LSSIHVCRADLICWILS